LILSVIVTSTSPPAPNVPAFIPKATGGIWAKLRQATAKQKNTIKPARKKGVF
jgi:hypothetical protein